MDDPQSPITLLRVKMKHFLVSYPDCVYIDHIYFSDPGLAKIGRFYLNHKFFTARAKNLRISRYYTTVRAVILKLLLSTHSEEITLKRSIFQRKKSNKRLNMYLNFRRLKFHPDIPCPLREWLILNTSANNTKQYSKSLFFLRLVLEEIFL